MGYEIKRVAVLGAGVMGSGIAAHLAGVGLKTLLLDIVPPELSEEDKGKGITREDPAFRNRFAASAIQKAKKAKPPMFFDPEDADLIEIGNFEDDLHRVADCDWIVEVVVEKMSIKQALFEKLEQHRRPGALVTSNTSGLSIKEMCAGRSDDFRKHFFVTHFFNPVRFMRLLELVAGEETDPAAMEAMARFGSDVLGKGIVYGKDTPNFIANRIGTYGMMYTLQAMVRDGFTVEEIDAVFGPVSGRPKSAVFRTADIVGLDTLAHVADNCYQSLTDDPEREVFKAPEFLGKMVQEGMLGAKTKAGFYKKIDGEINALDLQSFEYKPKQKVRADSIGKARKIDDVGKRIAKLLEGDDRLAKLAWEVTARTLIYSANMLGEIADDVVNCDRAMRWGFNWDLGPFETWDAIGVRSSVERMQADGMEVPEVVTRMLESGVESFYGGSVARPTYHDVATGEQREVPVDERQILIGALKEADMVVAKNASAHILDIGDGVLLVEFHTKMNAVDVDLTQMMIKAVDLAETDDWQGVVIGNEHVQSFSVGANIFALIMAINQKKWDVIEEMVKGFQDACMRLRYSDAPVVAAPAGLALGGGAEIVMGCDAVRTHAELYMGLVEMGVGLIPGGGGTLDLLERFMAGAPDDPAFNPLPLIQGAFMNIGMAKVSVGAGEAFKYRMLRPCDRITFNRDLLFHDAKQTVLGLARAGYRRPRPLKFRLPGASGAASIRWFLDTMTRGNQITEHEYLMGSKLAWVLCGGDTSVRVKVTQQQILDLEREAFLSLCGEPKSLERIQHMLTKNKPLRN
jgi:3-hydroxyacyl-CoA dehydrogenase